MKKTSIFFLLLTLLSCKNNDLDVQFAALKQSLSGSNAIIISGNNRIYAEMQNKLNDPQTRFKAEIWEPKTAEVKKFSAGMTVFFDKLEADVKKDITNGDAAKQLFEKQGLAVELQHRLNYYKKALIGIIKPEAFSDNTALHDGLVNYSNRLKESILLDAENDTAQTKNQVLNSNKVVNYFENTTVLGALAMLEKIRNDALTAENTLLQYFDSMTISYHEGYTRFSAIVTQSSTSVRPGEILKIYSGIGAFSVASRPTFIINGVLAPAGENGMSTCELTAAKIPGKYSVPVTVEFISADGSRNTVTKNVNYTVLQ